MRLTHEKVIIIDIGYALDISDFILKDLKQKCIPYIATNLLNVYKEKQNHLIRHATLMLFQDTFGWNIANYVIRPYNTEEVNFYNYVKDYMYTLVLDEVKKEEKKRSGQVEYFINVSIINTYAHIILSRWSKHGKSTYTNLSI